MKLLLELRNKLKAKKPSFARHDSHKKKRIGSAWRRPKGHQNKMRLHLKGYARVVATGFGSPRAVFGFSRTGLKQVLVSNISQLSSLDPKSDGLIISRTLGDRKRSLIVKEAKAKGFTILNFNPDVFEKKLESASKERLARKKTLDSRRKEKAKLKESKDSKKSKDSETKKDSSETANPEDKKLAEKKEHDKLLTKKGGEL